MDISSDERIAWFDVLTRRFSNSRQNGKPVQEKDQFSDPHGRTVLVAKARWILLTLVTIYGACACGFYYFSRFGFFLTPSQQFFLFACFVAVISYNSVYHFFYVKISHIRFINHFQILFDIFFVTTLVHFSGGSVSWFWPVYLIVTIEAAFLLERERDVWLLGAVGGFVYGAVLASEYFGILPNLKMPFAPGDLPFDPFYLVLIWFWASILNTAAAVILTFLMSVIRHEARLLRHSEERLVTFIESANDLIYSCTPDGKLLYANRTWQQVMGYGVEEIAGISLWDLIPIQNRPKFMEAIKLLMGGENVNLLETMFQTRDGREVQVEGHLTCSHKDGEPVATWGIFRDITERKVAQKQLYHLAHYDTLTNLPNRALLFERLQYARSCAKRAKNRMAVLFLDLDRFKIINDTMGHPVGDMLLVSVANRLSSCSREIDTVGRIGGDEFIIILGGLKDVSDADKFAHKVMKNLAEPHKIGDHELCITASIGISIYPDDDNDLDNLIKKADIAMYSAKRQGNNTYKFYDGKMYENVHKRFVMKTVGVRHWRTGISFFTISPR